MMKPNSKSLVCVVVDKKIEKFPIQQLESYAGYENGKVIIDLISSSC